MIQHKFLLVDDNPIDIMVHKRLLQNSFPDSPVIAFNNSADALMFFSDNRMDFSELPSVVLLDIIMPRVDGFAFIEELEKIFTKIPFTIFLLSSTLDDADFAKAKENKWVDTILGKPLDTESLRRLLGIPDKK